MIVSMVIIFAAAAAGLLVSVLKPVVKGKSGEAVTGVLLNQLPTEEYQVIHNLLLKTDRGTSQIDYVVVSVYGIFVIEVKNYKGWITGSEYGKQWTETIYQTKHHFMNPIHQNYGHVKAVENVLNDSSIPVYSIVAFSGECELKVKAEHTDVVLWGDLKDAIRKYSGEKVMSKDEMEKTASLLKSQNIDSRENRKRHVKDIQKEKGMKEEKGKSVLASVLDLIKLVVMLPVCYRIIMHALTKISRIPTTGSDLNGIINQEISAMASAIITMCIEMFAVYAVLEIISVLILRMVSTLKK